MNSPSMTSQATEDAAPFSAEFDSVGWSRLSETGIFEVLTNEDLTSTERIAKVSERMRKLSEAGENPGLMFAVATHLASTITSITRFGSPLLKQDVLPRMVQGQFIGAHAITEQDAGSDPSGMKASAVVDELDGSVVLNGTKRFITNAPIATHIVVYARTLRDSQDHGISAYLVTTDTPGFQVSSEATASLPESPIGRVELTDVRVPAGLRIGSEGAGLQVLDYVMKREIIYAFSSDLGRIRRRIDECIDFANRRQQFGAPIATYQSVSFTIADMLVKYQSGLAMIHEVISLLRNNKDITKEVSAAKIVISEANLSTAVDATHLRGGSGVAGGSVQVQDVIDALAGPIYSGTNRIQRTRIAAMLGVKPSG